MTSIDTLAAAARCINDADWGSERQIAAENAFYAHVESILSPANYHKLECRNWKASTDEAVDNTLAFLAEIAARTEGTR